MSDVAILVLTPLSSGRVLDALKFLEAIIASNFAFMLSSFEDSKTGSVLDFFINSTFRNASGKEILRCGAVGGRFFRLFRNERASISSSNLLTSSPFLSVVFFELFVRNDFSEGLQASAVWFSSDFVYLLLLLEYCPPLLFNVTVAGS